MSTAPRILTAPLKTNLTTRSPCLRSASVLASASRSSPVLARANVCANAIAGPSRLRSVQPRIRTFASSAKMSGPPAKKMAVFQKMTSEFPAQSKEFRRVLWTGESSQLVEMTIPVDGDIGEEVHHVDQHLIFTQGQCKAIVAGEERDIKAGDLVIVPQGTKHNFINTGKEPLVLFTVYAPAEHDPKSVHKTKEEGDKLEDEGKDEAPSWAKK